MSEGVAFVLFIGAVIGVSLYASRHEETNEDYFLAGRRLSWWLIGSSLIASNISTEHFVGTLMAGFMMLAYVFVALATVLYSGALALESIFGIPVAIGVLAGWTSSSSLLPHGGRTTTRRPSPPT